MIKKIMKKLKNIVEEEAPVAAPVSNERPDEIERRRVREEKAKSDQRALESSQGKRFGDN